MQIKIFHTNDIHSQFSFLENVFVYLQKHRTKNDFYLDAGDYTDISHKIVSADHGQMALELLSLCQPDVLTVGNNEADLGVHLKDLFKKFPYISANLSDELNQPLPHLPSSKLLKVLDKTILVIGITPYYNEHLKENGYNNFMVMAHLKIQEPFACLRRVLDERKGQYDYCLLLSHSGYFVDEKILDNFKEIDFILGGHSHQKICSNRYLQGGKGEFLDVLTLDVLEDGIHFLKSEQLVLADERSSSFDKQMNIYLNKADAILEKEMEVYDELIFDAFHSCELMRFLCDALWKDYGQDLAVMHHGIANHSLLRPVSQKSLLETFPSKLNPTMYEIKGKEILEAYYLSKVEDHIRQSGKGPGFRGNVLGTLSFSTNVEEKENCLFVNGEKILEERVYSIVTDDYLQRGTGYPSLKVADEICHYDNRFIRDVMEHHLMDKDLFCHIKNLKVR
ncbi:metallophosphoesterase [Bulleidia sp. zg-1013]|uniref:metallophosphoesterase n=1 Tax=Bacillati TaxID=1783272 RepID=UPI001C6F4EEC|nr:metallophosphoesterase [Trueperella sp. zg.1013]